MSGLSFWLEKNANLVFLPKIYVLFIIKFLKKQISIAEEAKVGYSQLWKPWERIASCITGLKGSVSNAWPNMTKSRSTKWKQIVNVHFNVVENSWGNFCDWSWKTTIPFYCIYFFIYCYLLTFCAEFLNTLS